MADPASPPLLNPPWRVLVTAVAWGAPMANPLADLYAARRVGEAAAGWECGPWMARASVDAFWLLVASDDVRTWSIQNVIAVIESDPVLHVNLPVVLVDAGLAAGAVVVTACGRDGEVSPTKITLRVN